MKHSQATVVLPRRELLFFLGFYLLCVSCVSGQLNWWLTLVTILLFLAIGVAVRFWLSSHNYWYQLSSHPFEAYSEHLKTHTVFAPEEALVIGPLYGLNSTTVLVSVTPRIQQIPQKPYTSFRLTPSPIRRSIQLQCHFTAWGVEEEIRTALAQTTARISDARMPDNDSDTAANTVSLSIPQDFGKYELEIQPVYSGTPAPGEYENMDFVVTIRVCTPRLARCNVSLQGAHKRTVLLWANSLEMAESKARPLANSNRSSY